jgi:filamentous hemagglutinin
VAAGTDLSLSATSLANEPQARVLAGRDLHLNIAGALTNNSSVIEAGRDVSISAGAVSNLSAGPSTREFFTQGYGDDVPQGYRDNVFAYVADPIAQLKLFGEAPPDIVYHQMSRVHINSRDRVYRDSGTSDPRFTLRLIDYGGPAQINAGRDLDLTSTGALTNDVSLMAAGRDMRVSAVTLDNIGRYNEAQLYLDVGVGQQHLAALSQAPSVIQAAGNVSASATGNLLNTGTIQGASVYAGGANLTNGFTDPAIPQISSTQPAAVISLAAPNLGSGIGAAQASLAAAADTTLSAPTGPNPFATPGSVLPSTQVFPGAASSLPISYLRHGPAAGLLAPLTPEYLLGLLPQRLVAGTTLSFYADPFTEQQLLRQAGLKEVGQAYFVNGLAYDDQNKVSIETQQRALLYENAARFAKDHGVVLGQALAPALQAKLDRPMLWYVEQELPDPNGNVVRALVPTVYLPQLYREQHPNLAGGVIRGEDVTLQAQGAITNTGYLLAGNQLSVSATEFINQKRLGNIGRIEEKVEGGYLVTTGERVVQEGAFVSAGKAMASLMKAMMRISPPQFGHSSGKTS